MMRLLRKVRGVSCFCGDIGRRLTDSCRVVGVNLTGTIVIARAGVNLRGIKVSSPQHLPGIHLDIPLFRSRARKSWVLLGV